MAVRAFTPGWVLCRVDTCRCSLCGRMVGDASVWRFFEAPARYVQSVCEPCALFALVAPRE